MKYTSTLADFLADVVMTGYYLAEPPKNHVEHLHDVEAKCLKIIYVMQPIKILDISRLLHITKPRATQLVHELENRGLVYRTVGADHRVAYIQTTPKGTQTVKELRKKYLDLAESINNRIGSEKTAELCEILQNISPLSSLMQPKVKGGK
jgi:DNA-binding MarR family transcriptional regulator